MFDVKTVVIVRYEEELFPGIVTSVDERDARVSVMQRSGQLWKWPDQKDEIDYAYKDVVEKMRQPVKKSHKRELYDIPELQKVWG
ncbi:hypothetical protein ANN_23781 [Periplaneta americana]|uniref:Uncharacterized protein n=1 Tax=Periplaneta americana TaxID=6978 RepID=A0ABQ8SM21_PERAM|nr:hypothetical protein ANN_23781 [Periplaneta americana]